MEKIIFNSQYFNVLDTLDCGQVFRFSPFEKGFIVVSQDKCAYLYHQGDNAVIECQKQDREYFYNYFDLSRDYAKICQSAINENIPVLTTAVQGGKGIRILNQDKWEALCSFIISQNNNIPRIKKIIESLSKKCGNKINIPLNAPTHLSDSTEYYTFPTPEDILELGVEGLTELKTGFRAKYIYDAALKVINGDVDLEYTTSLSTDDAIKHLCMVKGIGPKVASCALLFAFEKYDAFPIDVWIKKVISKYFITETNKDFSPSTLGKYAGIAQQYLFYYERYGGHQQYN